jgi:hypothetical protein
MENEDLDKLLKRLSNIADIKAGLPFGLRALVNSLGLHIHKRRASKWVKLEVGGKFKSYLDALRQEEGDWRIRKFNPDVWEDRFARLVGPTEDIASFLTWVVYHNKRFNDSSKVTLSHVVAHHESTGQWLGLTVPYLEDHVRRTPHAFGSWKALGDEYMKARRYKDMEKAWKNGLQSVPIDDSEPLMTELRLLTFYQSLAKTYFTALINELFGQGFSSWPNIQSGLTPASLSYSVEDVRSFAEKYLRVWHQDVAKGKHLSKELGLEEIELAIKATVVLSDAAWKQYETFMSAREKNEQARTLLVDT